MKRLGSMFALAGLLLAAPVAMAGQGDCNGDGMVDATDRTIAMEAVNTTDDGSNIYFADMDLDGDGVISLVDVSKISALIAPAQ